MLKPESDWPSVGRTLRELRLRAGLTQDRVAELMGYCGRHRSRLIQQLENGGARNPGVLLLGRFLQACGAKWHEIADMLDQLVGETAEPGAFEQAGLSPVQAWRLSGKVDADVAEYRRKLPRRRLKPESEQQAVAGMVKYRLVVEGAELKVTELLGGTELTKNWYPLYRAVCRQVVGRFWRMARTRKGRDILLESQSKVPEPVRTQMASDAEAWQRHGLDVNLVQEVQQVSADYVLRLFRANPERFPLRVGRKPKA